MTSKSSTMSHQSALPRWLWWLGVFYFLLIFLNYVAIFPLRYEQLVASQLPQSLVISQISSDYFAIIIIALLFAFLLLRRPYDRLVLLLALASLGGYPNTTGISVLSRDIHPILALVGALQIIFASSIATLLVLYVPDGKIIYKRLLWLIPLILLWDIARYVFFFVIANPDYQAWRPAALFVDYILAFPAFAALINRYRHHSNPVQRQQFKWFFLSIYGITITMAIGVILRGFVAFYGNPLIVIFANILVSVITAIGAIFAIFALLFAILRWGLWDVDLTINRGLVTGIVGLLLLLIFGGVFFLSQALLRSILGADRGEIAVTLAALLVGLGFNPIRQRVRNFVDRRLYGLRFDLNQLERAQHLAEIENAGALTGKVLGDYELLGVLGRGGMGEVYKGFGNGKLVAIKILQDSQHQKRFEREAAINIQHPNIVQTYGYGEAEGISFLTLEYIEGNTLKAYLQERGQIPFNEILPLLTPIADAVDTAHQQGYIHRDIKPANIMLRQGNAPVLMDFGLVKVAGEQTSLTGSGAVGTIDYMSPEQIMDSRQVDHRADIYALGVVLYEVLAGKLPFHGTAGQVLFAHLQQPPPDLRETLPTIPSNIAAAIQVALAKDPNERFQNAAEFLESLRSFS